MGGIIERAVYGIFDNLFLALLILPVAAIFLVYLIYIIVMTMKEWKK